MHYIYVVLLPVLKAHHPTTHPSSFKYPQNKYHGVNLGKIKEVLFSIVKTIASTISYTLALLRRTSLLTTMASARLEHEATTAG